MKDLLEIWTICKPYIPLVIYIIGYILAYYSLRYILRRDDNWCWGGFIFILFLSAASWITFIVSLGNILSDSFTLDNEPPKWL